MKKIFVAMFILVPLIFSSFSCGGDKSPVMVLTQKVSEDIADIFVSEGILSEEVILESQDGDFAVNISAGITALDEDGDPIDELTLDSPDEIPPPPAGIKNIAAVDFGPDGATFDEPVEVTLSYAPETLPAGTSPSDLIIAYYDEENERWVELADITVDTVNHTVTGKVTHFTLFAIQVAVGAAPEEETDTPEEETATPGEETGIEPVRQLFDLPALYYRFQDIIGQEVWVMGYYGDAGFGHSGVAFLVQEFELLLSSEVMPPESFARLDGNLPDPGENGAALLVHGVVRDYGQVYPDVYQPEPVPLVTVTDYEVLDVPAEGGELIDYLTWAPQREPAASGSVELVSFFEAPTAGVPETGDYDGEGGWSQASDCDRVLIISGGVSDSQNHSMYADNVKAIYEKMAGFGFGDAQIDVVYYTGNAGDIQVGGRNIVDAAATKENIRAIIEKYMREMNPSCSLEIFITDHGTGYNGGDWTGARMATSGSSENSPGSITYPESQFTLNGSSWLWDTAEFTDTAGRRWAYERHRFTGETHVFLRVGDSWVNKGNDADGDGTIEEHELGTDINGDGDPDDNFGFRVTDLNARATHSSGEWDDNRDGNPDLRFQWTDGKLVCQRLVNGTWTVIGEDTNGDGNLGAADGGLDWDGDGNKNGRVGFHEGINLLGQNVLWDDEFADLLRPLAENGIHINCIMQQCYSGGFIDNLTGIVEWIGTLASEDTLNYSYRVGTKYVSVELHHFIQNITSLDPLSWGTHWTAALAENQRVFDALYAGRTEAYKAERTNYQQLGGTPVIETETTTKKHDDGMYSISLRLHRDRASQIYDFEIILGLQSDRWQLSLGEGIGFPEGLPEGLDSEIIPGGVRVFSSSPLGPTPLLVRLRALEGQEISRIELTDENHSKIGYTMPGTEDIPATNPLEATLDVTVQENIDEDSCDCAGQATLSVSADTGDSDNTVAMVEVYIDGQLANRTRYWRDDTDPETVAKSQLEESYVRGVSEGRHTATVKITDWYGHVTTITKEFWCCQDQLTMIPISEAGNKLTLTASSSVQIEGTAPDCTATLTINWGAQAQAQNFKLKAAWLRVDGAIVASLVPPVREYDPEAGEPTDLQLVPFFGSWVAGLFAGPVPDDIPEPGVGQSETQLGGVYSCPVQPGSTVLIEVIALGSDCRYYIAAWERRIPDCPEAYIPPPWVPPCFSADTLVLMGDDSTKHISEIQLGDMVKSYDVASGQVIVKEVVTTNNGQSDHYYVINGNLKVTPPHPFFTLDRGWVPVESLQVGDQIKSVDGITTVTSVELVLEGQVIYNIRVEESGNFFVSANGNDFYLVHQGL